MTTSRRRARARLLLPALLAGLLALAITPTASAHDALVGSDPAAGATLPTMPARVTLTFAETPQNGLATLTVVAADGRHVEQGTAAVDDGRVSIGVDPAAAAGRYEIGYRVVSEDGHPVSGAIPFTTTASAAPASAAPAAPAAPTAPTAPTALSTPPRPSPGTPTPSPAAASSPAAPADSGGVPGWLVAVVAAVVVIGAVGFVVRRRT